MTIRKRGNQYCALSQDGTRNFGCFSTREEAEHRLTQVESFKGQKALSTPTLASEVIELGDMYEKDLIYSGSFVHPSTGQKFTIDRDRIDRWVTAHQKMIQNGVKIPFGEGHRFDSASTYGYMVGLRRDGDKAVGVFSIEDDVAKKKVGKGIQEVSVQIYPEYMDGKGVKYGEVLRHVAATPYPVIPGQSNFVSLSEGEEVEIFQLSYNMEDDTMDELLKALGVENEADAVAKVASLSEENAGFKTKIESLEKKVNELSVEDEVIEEDPKVKELSDKLEALQAERRKEFLDLAVDSGKLKPEQHELYLSLMVKDENAVRKLVDGIEPGDKESTELSTLPKTDDEAAAELAAIEAACK